jgi:hypothetical protein
VGVCRPRACFSVGLQQLKPTTMLSISRSSASFGEEQAKLSGVTAMERASPVDVLIVAEQSIQAPRRGFMASCRTVSRESIVGFNSRDWRRRQG